MSPDAFAIWHCFLFRVKFRSRLRALLTLSALAPSSLVAEVLASDKEKDEWCGQGEGLTSLADLRRFVLCLHLGALHTYGR